MIARFGDCEVDVDRVEIRRGRELVPVEPQVFDVIAYLIEHRGRVVTKEELLDNIWGDRFVSESALTSRIKSARQALGDSGRAQSVIKTVHGRGYRFVAAVQTGSAASRATGGATLAPPAGVVGDMEPTGVVDDVGSDDRWPLVGRHDELARLDGCFHDVHFAGILLTGPAGIGKTRLAAEFVAKAEAAGVPTVQISGHAESSGIPLGAVSHLLPPDVLDVAGQDAELARAIVFQRARAAVSRLAGSARLVLMIDDVDRLDELSRALVGSLLTTVSVFAVMTQRTAPGGELAFSELVRGHHVAHLELAALDDTELDVLLYRVLSGPIELQSLESLTQLARGRPGALEQLVATCRATGAFGRRDGVWRLSGPIHGSPPTLPETPAVETLPDRVTASAELLAVAGDLDLDLATDLIGVEALDTLDRAGLLALSEASTGSRVSLAHPHHTVALLEQLGPLRSRRHKARLIGAIRSSAAHVAIDSVRTARWSIEVGDAPNREDVLAAIRTAVTLNDAADGEVLIDHLERTAPGDDVTALSAELAFRLGRVEAADEQLNRLDLSRLDRADATRVVRRRATILFHVRGRYQDAVDLLLSEQRELDGDVLRGHAVGLLGFLGFADQIGEVVTAMPDDFSGLPALEVLRGRAQAALVGGRYSDALDLIDLHDAGSTGIEPTAAQAGNEVATSIRIQAHTANGEIARAIELLHAQLPAGQRTMLAWLPLAACSAHLAAGHPRAARAVIMTPLAAVRSQNLLHAEPLMTAALARATAHLGDADTAHAQLEFVERTRQPLVGRLRWVVSQSMADAFLALGDRDRAIEVASADVDDALARGATATAAALLFLSGIGGAATEALPRLERLVGDFDGSLWPLRLRHVAALANSDVDAIERIAAEYEALGYRRPATPAPA